MTQPMDDLPLPEPQGWDESSIDWVYYTADQMREYAKQAVEAEQTIWKERVKFTAERWEIECKSQVEIEREACAKVADKWSKRGDDVGGYIARNIRARGQA